MPISDNEITTTLDYLGRSQPLGRKSLSLAASGGGGGGPVSAPVTPQTAATPAVGSGALGNTALSFASDVMGGVPPSPGEGVEAGHGLVGGGTGPGFSQQFGPVNVTGSPFGMQASIGPVGVGLSPFGTVGARVTTGGGRFADTAINLAISTALAKVGIPVTAQLLGMLSPAVGAIAGPAGLGLTGFSMLQDLAEMVVNAMGHKTVAQTMHNLELLDEPGAPGSTAEYALEDALSAIALAQETGAHQTISDLAANVAAGRGFRGVAGIPGGYTVAPDQPVRTTFGRGRPDIQGLTDAEQDAIDIEQALSHAYAEMAGVGGAVSGGNVSGAGPDGGPASSADVQSP